MISIFGIILWIIIGGLAGWLASKIMGTSAEQGMFMDVVVGIAGSLIGGFLLQVVTAIANVRIVGSGGLIFSFLTSLLGAVVLLAVMQFFRRRR